MNIELTIGRREITVAALLACATILGYKVGAAHADGPPDMNPLTYSGVAQKASGEVLTGTHPVQLKLWSAATDGTEQCNVGGSGIDLGTTGYFSISLTPAACVNAVQGNKDVWVEVLVDGTSTGRAKIGAVPYALETKHTLVADSATNAMNATTATNATNAANAASATGALDQRITAVEQAETASAQHLMERIKAGSTVTLPQGTNSTVTGGTVNPSTTQMLWQAGTTVVGTDGAGLATITYPTPFPNGVLSVVVMDGDANGFPLHMGLAGSTNTSSFQVKVYSSNGSIVSMASTARFNWVAVGW